MAKKKTKHPEMMQTVWITFYDGRKCAFTGKVAVKKGDQAWISEIHFAMPKPLPPGFSFEEL